MRKRNEFCSCIASAQQLETDPPGKDLYEFISLHLFPYSISLNIEDEM